MAAAFRVATPSFHGASPRGTVGGGPSRHNRKPCRTDLHRVALLFSPAHRTAPLLCSAEPPAAAAEVSGCGGVCGRAVASQKPTAGDLYPIHLASPDLPWQGVMDHEFALIFKDNICHELGLNQSVTKIIFKNDFPTKSCFF